jgi:hypothetical protein
MIEGVPIKPCGWFSYSEYITVLTIAGTTRCDRETLSGSGSLKNKVFQTAYFSDWKVEFTVRFAMILCLAPAEGVA